MKTSCERCGAPFQNDADARVCSYDCTFCTACADSMNGRCPNCDGALAPRSSAA